MGINIPQPQLGLPQRKDDTWRWRDRPVVPGRRVAPLACGYKILCTPPVNLSRRMENSDHGNWATHRKWGGRHGHIPSSCGNCAAAASARRPSRGWRGARRLVARRRSHRVTAHLPQNSGLLMEIAARPAIAARLALLGGTRVAVAGAARSDRPRGTRAGPAWDCATYPYPCRSSRQL